MSIKVALEHRTSYSFDRLVGECPQVVRLRPAPHCLREKQARIFTDIGAPGILDLRGVRTVRQ